jgi:4-amino-4-deoxy-L-arabinose transferase-like glycosyltransferase
MLGIFFALIGILGLLAAFEVMTRRSAGIIGCVLFILAGLQILLRGKCKCCTAP